MQNKVRNQLSLIFKAPQLRRLERAIRCRNRPATQSLLEELSGVPEGLKAAAQKLLAGFRPDPELPPKQASAEPKAHTVPPPKAVPPGLRVGAPPETGEDAQPLPVKAKALPLQPKFKAKGPAPVKPGQDSETCGV